MPRLVLTSESQENEFSYFMPLFCSMAGKIKYQLKSGKEKTEKAKAIVILRLILELEMP